MSYLENDTVSIVGAGTMGHGLAVVFAMNDYDVRLFDVEGEALDEAWENVISVLATFNEMDYLSDAEAEQAADRIERVRSFETAVSSAGLVIEAAPEQIEIKLDVFERLDDYARDRAILATNTSGLSIDKIAKTVEDPGRVVGTHWFNPPYIVPLVEIVRGQSTDDAIVDYLYDEFEAIGKTPVVVKKDIPGFIANRIQLAMDYEAWSLLARGIASAEDIDRAVKAGFGFRIPALGVFTKADFAGLDVFRDIQEYLMDDLDRGTAPNTQLEDFVEAGRKGLKSGHGVYDWSDMDASEAYEWRDRQLITLLKAYEELK